MSSEDGKVTFTDVEYGDYVLKETFVSEGYVSTISSNGLAISKKDLAGAFNKNDQDSPESFAYTFTQPSDGQSVVNSGTVVNKLYRAVIKFHKSDDDGNPLGDIKFDIFRRSPNAVSADGTGMQMKAEDTVTSYWKYGPEPAVISAADGNFQVTLPYGDYLLVENEPEDLTDGHNSEAIHSYKIKEIEAPFGFQLNRTDTGELTEVSFEIGEGEGVNGTLGGHEGTAWISISRDTGSAVYTSIGAPAPADSKAENTISRGSIALIKTNRADKEEDTMRLSGASFAVYAGVPGNAAEGEADSKTLAAMLTESPAEAGRYELSNQTADGKAINAKDSAGRRYLLDDGTGKLGLLSGDYYIEEQERPYGYLLSNVQTAFTLKDDGSIELKPAGNPPARLDESETGTIIFSDEKIWSDISLTNYYKGTDTVISNVAFTLYRINKDGAGTESEEAIETKVTDGNGTLVFEKVPEGEYRIKENLEESIKAGAPSDVYIDTAWSSEVIAVGTETHSTVINIGKVENESFRASVSLNKYDAENGDPIQDTVFLLERKEGENFVPVSNENGGYHKTDEKGQLKIDILKTGHYRLTETEAAPGYILNEGAGFFCEFDVTNAEFNEDIEIQSVNLAAGNYGMTAGNYEMTAGNYEMTAGNNEAAGNDDTAADNGTADRAASLLTEKGLGNERKTGSVFLQKIGESEEILLNSVEFALYKKDAEGNYGELAKVLTGNSYSAADGYTVPVPAGEGKEGSLTITGLTWGDYRIRETKPLPGYKLNPAEFDFTIGRTTNEMKLEADLDKISNEANEITIVKQDEEGNPLEGAVFTVTKADEADIDAADTKNVTTGEDGTAVLTKELTGDTVYILHEETVPSGYLRADDVRFVMGMDGNIVPAEGETAGNIENNTITVTDRLTYLSFTKKSRIHEDCSDPELGVPSPDVVKPLEGVEFTIYAPAEPEEEPKEICRVYSDENGLAEKNGLPAGTYEIRETKPAEGYLANDTVYIAEIDPENGFTGLSIKGAEENSQVEDN